MARWLPSLDWEAAISFLRQVQGQRAGDTRLLLASTPPDFSNNSNTFIRVSSFLPGSSFVSIDVYLDLTVYLGHKLYEEVPGSISMGMGSFRRSHCIFST